MSKEVKRYAERDIMALDAAGNYYCRHVSAMTREGLHSKSDIAAELGWRDMQIDALLAERDVLVEALGSMTCAYRMAIQAGHARITALGGDCDDVERMLADFPDYGKAVELYKLHRATLQGEHP